MRVLSAPRADPIGVQRAANAILRPAAASGTWLRTACHVRVRPTLTRLTHAPQTYSGLPLVDPATGAETRRVHVYAPRWAWQNDGYEAVAFKAPLLR